MTHTGSRGTPEDTPNTQHSEEKAHKDSETQETSSDTHQESDSENSIDDVVEMPTYEVINPIVETQQGKNVDQKALYRCDKKTAYRVFRVDGEGEWLKESDGSIVYSGEIVEDDGLGGSSLSTLQPFNKENIPFYGSRLRQQRLAENRQQEFRVYFTMPEKSDTGEDASTRSSIETLRDSSNNIVGYRFWDCMFDDTESVEVIPDDIDTAQCLILDDNQYDLTSVTTATKKAKAYATAAAQSARESIRQAVTQHPRTTYTQVKEKVRKYRAKDKDAKHLDAVVEEGEPVRPREGALKRWERRVAYAALAAGLFLAGAYHREAQFHEVSQRPEQRRSEAPHRQTNRNLEEQLKDQLSKYKSEAISSIQYTVKEGNVTEMSVVTQQGNQVPCYVNEGTAYPLFQQQE